MESWEGWIVMVWVVMEAIVCVMLAYGPQMGRTRAENQGFREALEMMMMGMVGLEVMLCIAGDVNTHV